MLVFFVTKLFLLDYINIQTFSDSSCLEFAKKSRSLVGADSGSTEDTNNISEDLVSVTEKVTHSCAFCAFLELSKRK